MNAQQLLDIIIRPTLELMGGNYNSKDAQMLLLATAAIESNCGHYIKQMSGPAVGIWQMEPETACDIWGNCDALKGCGMVDVMDSLSLSGEKDASYNLLFSPRYACAMARLKYSMDTEPLPVFNDGSALYDYYKRVYNTHLGASTLSKFNNAWVGCGLSEVRF